MAWVALLILLWHRIIPVIVTVLCDVRNWYRDRNLTGFIDVYKCPELINCNVWTISVWTTDKYLLTPKHLNKCCGYTPRNATKLKRQQITHSAKPILFEQFEWLLVCFRNVVKHLQTCQEAINNIMWLAWIFSDHRSMYMTPTSAKEAWPWPSSRVVRCKSFHKRHATIWIRNHIFSLHSFNGSLYLSYILTKCIWQCITTSSQRSMHNQH